MSESLSSSLIEISFRTRCSSGMLLDVSFTAPGRGITALFGPSGAGKTTILRLIAGLERTKHGRCVVAGECWQDNGFFLHPCRRAIGYVFQEARLFPHLSVLANLRYGMRWATNRWTTNIGPDFAEVIELLRLSPLLWRGVEQLSGGERQRVAIGRALLSNPRLLLMDEPLAALDYVARKEILFFITELSARLPLPILYVGHDWSEIEMIAHHLVLINHGLVIADGTLARLQSDPNLPFMAESEAGVSLDVTVTNYDNFCGLVTMGIAGGGMLRAPSAPLVEGSRRRVRVLASDVSLALVPPLYTSIINIMPACIDGIHHTSDEEVTVVLRLYDLGNGAKLLARIARYSFEEMGLVIRQDIFAQINRILIITN